MKNSGGEMQDKDNLSENIAKIHTTEMGIKRISRNLGINGDVVEYCRSKILKNNAEITRKGKNYYVEVDECIITVNASSFTIITAHKK